MIKSLAVARVQQLLGFRSDLLEEAGQALIESQEDAESGELGFLPWFLRSTLRILLPANSREIPLPNDYLREYDHERYALWFTRAGPAVRVEYFSPSGDGTLKSGRPCYWVDSNALILDRSFNEAVDVEYLYYRRDNTLEEDIENSWEIPLPDFSVPSPEGEKYSTLTAGPARVNHNAYLSWSYSRK